jgi:hypothetical protein
VVVKPLRPVVAVPGEGDVVANVPLPAGDLPQAGTAAAADSVGEESAPPVQRVKYLRVANRTGQDLRVYVRAGDDEGPSVRHLPAGGASYVMVDGRRLAASEIRVWAKSDTSAWAEHKHVPLALVPEPYRAAEVATYTHVFE